MWGWDLGISPFGGQGHSLLFNQYVYRAEYQIQTQVCLVFNLPTPRTNKYLKTTILKALLMKK